MNTVMLLIPTIILLFFIAGGMSVKNGNDAYIDMETNRGLRGLCALCIFFHHYAQTQAGWEMFLLKHFGYLVMNVFFMLSGYGIMYSFLHKGEYLKKIFFKKLIKLILLYWFMNLTMYIYNFLAYGAFLSAGQIWGVITGKFVTHQASWFLWVLILLYMMFYAAAKCAAPDRIAPIVAGLSAVMAVAFKMTGKPLWYYNYIGGFAIGIHMMQQEEKRVQKLRYRGNAYVCMLAILTVLFYGVSKTGKLIVLPAGIGSFWDIAAVACSICLVLFTAEVLKKMCFRNRICTCLGRLSAWIYVLHGVVQACVIKYVPGRAAALWISLGITLILAGILGFVTGKKKKQFSGTAT